MKLKRLNRAHNETKADPMHIMNNWLCKMSRGNLNLCLSFSSAWFSVYVNCNITREDRYNVKKAELGLTKAETG